MNHPNNSNMVTFSNGQVQSEIPLENPGGTIPTRMVTESNPNQDSTTESQPFGSVPPKTLLDGSLESEDGNHYLQLGGAKRLYYTKVGMETVQGGLYAKMPPAEDAATGIYFRDPSSGKIRWRRTLGEDEYSFLSDKLSADGHLRSLDDPRFVKVAIEIILPVLQANGGRIFVNVAFPGHPYNFVELSFQDGVIRVSTTSCLWSKREEGDHFILWNAKEISPKEIEGLTAQLSAKEDLFLERGLKRYRNSEGDIPVQKGSLAFGPDGEIYQSHDSEKWIESVVEDGRLKVPDDAMCWTLQDSKTFSFLSKSDPDSIEEICASLYPNPGPNAQQMDRDLVGDIVMCPFTCVRGCCCDGKCGERFCSCLDVCCRCCDDYE